MDSQQPAVAKVKLLTFCSSMGSPGKSTLACAIATELADSGKRVLVIDADTYAPSIDVLLGLNDHPAGLAAACRLVSQERFDLEQLQRLSVELEVGGNQLMVMTGLSSSSRWAEVTPQKLGEIIDLAEPHFDFILLDISSSIESQITSPHSSVDRNSISRWAISNADQVLAISGADPVSIARHLDFMSQVGELRPVGEVLTIVNRLRASVLGSSAKQQIIETLSALGQLQVAGFVPDDSAAADAALKSSISIALSKRSSQARLAIALFTKSKILGERNPLDRRLFRAVAKLS